MLSIGVNCEIISGDKMALLYAETATCHMKRKVTAIFIVREEALSSIAAGRLLSVADRFYFSTGNLPLVKFKSPVQIIRSQKLLYRYI